jgi:mannose-6-phosphate isomerase
MFGLFAGRFFQADPGVLIEYFDDRLVPASGVPGRVVEPGHHFEWIWLLRWYERESGTIVGRHVDALYRHAERYGSDRAGLIVDELLVDGSVKTASHRLWPMTEAIRAHLVEARLGRPGAAARAAALADLLFERFLSGAAAGGWIDRLDAAGRPATDFMPASSLYHLLGAIDELTK